MRSSSYIIQSRLEDGKWILVHGYSGAVDVVEPGVVEFLAAASRGDFVPGASSGERFRLCAADVETLTSRCYITNRSEEEEREITSRLAAALHRQNQRHPGIGGVIVPTYDCNLRCRYCYERRLQEHGRAWLGATMTCEKVDAVYAFLERSAEMGGQSAAEGTLPPTTQPRPVPKHMTLLGGEPLLARNRELVLYILRQGVERGYEFSVISNATELDAFLPELAGLNVKFIQITLDGLKHTHDRRRFGPQREGSFDRIVPNVGRALRAGLRVSLRVNVDATNFDEVRALAELAGREGWVGSPTFDMYVAPVYTGAGKCGLDESVALPDAQLAEKMADLHRAVPSARIVRHAPAVERVFMGLFRSGQYLGFKGEFCGSSGAMHIFDPYGKMYACWESVGQRVGELGSYFPQVAYDEAAVESWRGRVVTSIPQCRACKYALLCGGGCPQHAYNANGSLRSPACRDFQRVLDTGLPVFYRKFLQEQGAGREGAVPGQAQPPGMGATVGAVAGERG